MQGFLAKAQTSRPVKNEKGITLIELLAVIVILGIIAAIAVPAIGGMISKSRVNADIESHNIVRDAGLRYAMTENLPAQATPYEIGVVTPVITDADTLVGKGYLNEAPKLQSDKFGDSFTSVKITVTNEGTYTVVVTDENGADIDPSTF